MMPDRSIVENQDGLRPVHPEFYDPYLSGFLRAAPAAVTDAGTVNGICLITRTGSEAIGALLRGW